MNQGAIKRSALRTCTSSAASTDASKASAAPAATARTCMNNGFQRSAVVPFACLTSANSLQCAACQCTCIRMALQPQQQRLIIPASMIPSRAMQSATVANAHLIIGRPKRSRKRRYQRVEPGGHSLPQSTKHGAKHFTSSYCHLGVSVPQPGLRQNAARCNVCHAPQSHMQVRPCC